MSQHGEGDRRRPTPSPLDDAVAATAVAAIHTEGRGRLRVLAARVSDEATTDGRSGVVGAAGRRLALAHPAPGRRRVEAPRAPYPPCRSRHRAGAGPGPGDRMSNDVNTAPARAPTPEIGRGRSEVAMRRRQVPPDAGARRLLRRLRRRHARARPPRHRDPHRPRRRRLGRAVPGDLRAGRGGHPRRHDRQAGAADPLGRARRRRPRRPRHGADLPLDRRAAGGCLQDAGLDRRPRHRLPRPRGRARRRDRVGRPDRDRLARSRRRRGLPQRAGRQPPRADGPHGRRRRAARGPADAVAADRRRHVLRQRRRRRARRTARDRRRCRSPPSGVSPA